MEDLQMEKFNPTVAELSTLADQYKGLKINGIEDEEGALKVKEARKDLQRKRIDITKFGKSLREKAIKFQKDVIEEEKKLVEIIGPIEDELEAEEERIKQLKLVEERKYILPIRKKTLEEAGIEKSDEEILAMNDTEFEMFVQSEKARMFENLKKEQEERERKTKEEKDKIEREQAIEFARKDAEQKAIKETEERLKKEQEEKEMRERIEKENKEKAEKENQLKLEQETKYQQWLTENNYSKEGEEFFIASGVNKKILYRKVSEFIL